MPSSKITILTHEFYPRKGGISVYVQEMARSACEMGYRVEVWAPAHPRIAGAGFIFAVKPLALKGTQGWNCRIRLAREIWKNRKDLEDSILYLPEPAPIRTMMYMRGLLPAGRNRIVITLHGSEILNLSVLPHRKIFFRKLLNAADKIGVVSRFTQRLLVSNFPDLRTGTIVTPGALRAIFRDIDFVPRKPSEKTVVLTVARVHPRKGQLDVLRGVAGLSQSLREKIDYRIAGPIIDQDYFREIEKFAKAQNLNVQFLGELKDRDLVDACQQADLFAMTSVHQAKSVEGYGLAYLEAAACGLPTIAYRSGGAPEAVQDGETGILVEPGDTDGLANALTRLAGDSHLREKFGRNGTQWAGRHSWEANVRQLFGDPA